MSEKFKSKTVELTDEEIEKSSGGSWLNPEGDFLAKRCGKCNEKFDYDLKACPICGRTTGLVVGNLTGKVYRAFPEYETQGGPR